MRLRNKILLTLAGLVFLVEMFFALSLFVSSDFSVGSIVLGHGYGEWAKVQDSSILEQNYFCGNTGLRVANIWLNDNRWKASTNIETWDKEYDWHVTDVRGEYETLEQGQRAVEEYIKKNGACK